MLCKDPWAFSKIFLKLGGWLLLEHVQIVANLTSISQKRGCAITQAWAFTVTKPSPIFV